MTRRVPDGASEARLAQLRDDALRTGWVDHAGVRPGSSPLPRASAETGYYGRPMLKPPPWTWEIPVYFFVGGAAGAAAIIAAAAQGQASGSTLARDARWMAVGGSAVSGALLISDLGRPERFLHMLRVIKPQSPMSMGVWTLLAFSGAVATGALADVLIARSTETRRRRALRVVRGTADVAGALTGSVLSTYTGVLLGVTAVPVWARSIRTLPATFGVSGMASAVACLELMGHRHPALGTIGMAAASADTALAIAVERRDERALAAVKHGPSGWAVRAGDVLAGPVALLARALARRRPRARRIAAVATLAGAFLIRLGWFRAGSPSSQDPVVTLDLPGS